jgi:hypothetical protein
MKMAKYTDPNDLSVALNVLEAGDYRLDNGTTAYYIRTYCDDDKLDLVIVNGLKVGYEFTQDLNGTGIAFMRSTRLGNFTVAILRTQGMTWNLEKVEA